MDETAAKTIWLYKLISMFQKANETLNMHMRKRLEKPMFSIDDDMGRKWGQWLPDERRIRLNSLLFKQFEEGAVERVLKHEMGHMVCSEIFGYNGGCSHGEHWKIACNALGLENPTRCDAADYLAGFKRQFECSVADRIRKLLAKGSDSSVTKEESQVFLNKAQEMMMRHQITMKDLVGSDKLYVKRPLGKGYYGKSFPAWIGQLGMFLQRHYSVNAITNYVWNCKDNKSEKYLEIFGMPDDVEIAEYVFYAIYNNGINLYNKAYEEHKELMKDEDYKSINFKWERARKFTMNSFMMGLIQEFSRKLSEQKSKVEDKINLDEEIRGAKETYDMVYMKNKGLLDEMFGKAYGRIRSTQCGARMGGASYGAGMAAGRGFSLSHGVKSGGNMGRLIGG